MSLTTDFETVVDLCCTEEALPMLPPRLKRRIANAYSRAIEKAIVMAWYEIPESARTNHTVFRHAERGAREFIPSS